MNNKFIFLFLILSIYFSNGYSQSIKEKIESIYSFKIAELSSKDLENKYKQLDKFWQELNVDTTKNLPIIRKELQASGHSSYFYFDMSSYLEMHSFKASDKRIIEGAIKKIEWTEIGTWELIEKLRDFSLNGIDVSEIAFQLFKQEKLKLTDPESGEIFNQGKITAYLLLPLKKELYLEKVNVLFDKLTPESQRSAISLFWLTNTKYGNERLQEITKNMKYSMEVRVYAGRLLNQNYVSDEDKKTYATMKEAELKQSLVKPYNTALISWDNHSWDKLIQLSKLMHFYGVTSDIKFEK